MRLPTILILVILTGLFAQTAFAGSVTPSDPGWTLVRRVTDDYGSWHPATDNLMGTSVYGNSSTDPLANETFSISFEGAVAGWDQALVATGDERHWIIFERTELGVYLFNASFDLLASSLNPNAHSVLAYNRGGGNPEDPWLSTQDHGSASGMLYGENAYTGHTSYRITNNGANVFIRNSTAGTTVPLPSAAWAALGLLGILGAVRRYRKRTAG